MPKYVIREVIEPKDWGENRPGEKLNYLRFIELPAFKKGEDRVFCEIKRYVVYPEGEDSAMERRLINEVLQRSIPPEYLILGREKNIEDVIKPMTKLLADFNLVREDFGLEPLVIVRLRSGEQKA